MRTAIEAGDRAAALTSALRLYGGEIHAFLKSTNPDVADDVFGELCEVIWQRLATFRWESSLRSWLYTIARNIANRMQTTPQRRRDIPLDLAPEVRSLAAQIRTETDQILRTEVKDAVRALRAELAPEDHELLLLRVDREMSWRDIARVTGSGGDDLDQRATALRKRFERAKERLRTLAIERGLFESPT